MELGSGPVSTQHTSSMKTVLLSYFCSFSFPSIWQDAFPLHFILKLTFHLCSFVYADSYPGLSWLSGRAEYAVNSKKGYHYLILVLRKSHFVTLCRTAGKTGSIVQILGQVSPPKKKLLLMSLSQIAQYKMPTSANKFLQGYQAHLLQNKPDHFHSSKTNFQDAVFIRFLIYVTIMSIKIFAKCGVRYLLLA